MNKAAPSCGVKHVVDWYPPRYDSAFSTPSIISVLLALALQSVLPILSDTLNQHFDRFASTTL